MPWAVALTVWDVGLRPDADFGRQGFVLDCSAVVIGPQRVLTASHCVDVTDLKRIAVNVGADDLGTGPGRLVPVARAWVLDKTAPLLPGHDLAVLETTEPLDVAPLPLATARPQPGEAVSSYGWGRAARSVDSDDDSARLLRRLDSAVAATCKLDAATALCVEAPNGGGIRPGDSGGPLVVVRDGIPQLAGIASAIDAAGVRGIFTDVTRQGAFVGAPPDEALFPVLRQPRVRIAGRVRPGGRVTCAGTFSPTPTRIRAYWWIGSEFVGPRLRVRGPGGKRVPVRMPRKPISQKRSFTIPRDASGKRIACVLDARVGRSHSVTLGVEQRIPRG